MSLLYTVNAMGAVVCLNRHGLVFFLPGELPSRFREPSAAPKPPATSKPARVGAAAK